MIDKILVHNPLYKNMTSIKSIIKIFSPADLKSIIGNCTYVSQAPLGGFCLLDGGCSIVDSGFCSNPFAKPLFISGAVINVAAGTCLVGAFGLGFVCLPAAGAVGIVGTVLRRIGKYTVKVANTIEPKPTFSSFSTKLSDVVQLAL
jgi:hypothetical protein